MMNIKMAINSQLSIIESRTEAEQKQNHRYGDHLEGCHLGGGREKMRERCRD